MAQQWVFDFDEADPDNRSTLGGKGSGLVRMTRSGLPVPPGFVVSTDACKAHLEVGGDLDPELWVQITSAIKRLESRTAKEFGGAKDPLLVSVRSGAPISMPGMMDTVLNLGMNETSLRGLADMTGDEEFASSTLDRFRSSYLSVVHSVNEPTAADLEWVPDDPWAQLRAVVSSVFRSWNTPRAIAYRRIEGIPNSLGTAAIVQAMVFGNASEDSGTGVVFSRNPATGSPGLWGEYLPQAQGEDVVAGVRTPLPIDHLAVDQPAAFERLSDIARQLEAQARDVQDIEFTIERGVLWILQTRDAKRTGGAAVRIAVDMVEEGVISATEAVNRVTPRQVEEVMHPTVRPLPGVAPLIEGLAASPGGATGVVTLTADRAEALAADGTKVILIRDETNPDDFHGMVAAQAIVTARGGMTSHAAVVARGIGRPAVVGCVDLVVDYDNRRILTPAGSLEEGATVTVDGTLGLVFPGEQPLERSSDGAYLEQLLGWADQQAIVKVRANADTPRDAEVAVKLGAHGIGLCRSEHMFFEPERLAVMRSMILADTEEERVVALTRLEEYQFDDFVGLFRVLAGRPITIRLLDPPLHEFLPRDDQDRAGDAATYPEGWERRVEQLREANPMLGHRGCRLGITHPSVTAMQSRAIGRAMVASEAEGIDLDVEIMVPLVGSAEEMENQKETIEREIARLEAEHKTSLPVTIGSMIELPRACITAGEIARTAEFFSFGTNDLTQTTLGMSRDDSASFLGPYLELGIRDEDPFVHVDEAVGELIEMAIARGKAARPDLETGVCGEHAGDPESISRFAQYGVDYVSCSPYRVPIARLATAHAANREVHAR